MKHNYKIKIDAPLPTEEQIARHKDFNRVMQDYQKFTQPIYRKPLYKNPKAFLGLAMIMVIGFLVFQAVEEEDQQKAKENTAQNSTQEMPREIVLAEENSFLRPPVPALTPASLQHHLEAAKPSTLRLADGTTLKIPADAFTSTDGKPLQGQVDISIRILRDPIDYVLAGIPLYTSDGMLLETTAAFDLSATQNGQPVQLRPDKPIHVLLPLREHEGMQPMNLSQLDTKSRAWASAPSPEINAHDAPNAASLHQPDDGFGVVEFGPDGKQIRRKEMPQENGSAKKRVQEFELAGLGIQCVSRALRPANQKEIPVKLVADGKALPLYSLYRMSKGMNSAAFFWPVSADFSFMLRWSPGVDEVFFGFLPDGRVASIRGGALAAAQASAQQAAELKAEISAAPITNKAALMQHLGI